MGRVWVCEWEVAPGDGQQKTKYKSYEEAAAGIRKLIVEHVDISRCVAELRDENYAYASGVADFLERYFSDPCFPYSEDDIPPIYYEDYPKISECIDYDDWPDGEFEADADFLHFSYGDYTLDTGFVMPLKTREGYSFMWECDKQDRGSGANDMILSLDYEGEWGTSAYPVMILRVLQWAEAPMTQGQIIEHISDVYGKKIERKAVGRHIDMLTDLGFKINKTPAGYRLEK